VLLLFGVVSSSPQEIRPNVKIVRLSKEYFIIVCFEANISKTMRL
jgi:hypothetical protein